MAPLQLAPNALALGGWSCLPDSGAPARYRHACAVVGARLFVYGGRGNSGRLASGLHQLDLLTGRWSVPAIAGEPPDLRWGHSMNTFRQYVIVFGGHRRRGCLNDTTMLDTEAMQWDTPLIEGVLPPPRGNHAAAVVSEKLWLFGGDAATFGVLPHTVWCLPLASPGSPAASWTAINATGEPAPPCSDHAAVAIGARVLLLGGSSPQGYLELQRIPTFHTDTLSWSRLVTNGAVPSARAGHVACAITGSGTSFQVFLFGGGNSATGFDDIVVLRGGAAEGSLGGLVCFRSLLAGGSLRGGAVGHRRVLPGGPAAGCSVAARRAALGALGGVARGVAAPPGPAPTAARLTEAKARESVRFRW